MNTSRRQAIRAVLPEPLTAKSRVKHRERDEGNQQGRTGQIYLGILGPGSNESEELIESSSSSFWGSCLAVIVSSLVTTMRARK